MSTDGTPPSPERLAEIQTVTERAKAGDPAALPRLRQLLVEYPELWQHYGDLAGQSLAIWVALIAGSDLYLRESLARKVADLKNELAGDSTSPLVGLLVDRVVATWLEANSFAAKEGSALLSGEGPRVLAFRAKRRQ